MPDDLTSRLAALSGGNAPAQTGQAGQTDDLTSRLQQVSGTAPVSMTGPKGEQVQVPASQVDSMRAQNYAVNPGPNTKLMITPEGKLTHALPDEVDKFKASGHVLVQPDGTFTVEPLPGEDNTDTMARAAKIGKAVTPDMIAAEKQKLTPARVATTLVAAPVMGAVGTAGVTGIGEGAGAVPVVAPIVKQALTSEPAMKAYTWVGKKVLEGAGLGIGYKILKWTGVL